MTIKHLLEHGWVFRYTNKFKGFRFRHAHFCTEAPGGYYCAGETLGELIVKATKMQEVREAAFSVDATER